MPTDDAVIITAVRTPVGRIRGQFASLPAWTLGEIAVREAVKRAGIDPTVYDDVIIGDHGSLRRLDCGGMVVGLFDTLSFEEATVQLQPGEIFIAYSDGVTEPENEYGEFGEQRLIELVHENRHLPLVRITEIVTAAVDDWIGPHEQPDDVTLVLARAR